MAERTESPTGDPLISEAERAEEEARAQRAANLFDLRRIIGGLFLIYGAILTVVGLTDSDKEIQKAAGTHVNLYTGLAMIAVAIFFLVWAFTRPLSKQLEEAEREVEEYDRMHGTGGAGDAAAHHARAGGARRLEAVDGRLDLGDGGVVVVAQARVRRVELATDRVEVARAQRRHGGVDPRVLGQHMARAARQRLGQLLGRLGLGRAQILDPERLG